MNPLPASSRVPHFIRHRAADRRREPRVACRRLITLLPPGRGRASGPWRVRLVDCSPHGIGILAHEPLAPGQRVIVAAKFVHVFLGVYTVLHCAPGPDGRYRIGAALTELLGAHGEDLNTAFGMLLYGWE